MTEAAIREQEMKKCPACAELILADAMKCKHCGERLAARSERDGSQDASFRSASPMTWVMMVIALGLAAGGAAIPFSETAREARKVSQRIGALDWYLEQIGNDDKVLMKGKVVPRQQAEAKIAELRREARSGFTALDREVAEIELAESAVATKESLLKLRTDSSAARSKWWMILTGSGASIVAGFGIAIGALVRHRRISAGNRSHR